MAVRTPVNRSRCVFAMLVLLVEDTDDLRTLFARVLHHYGFEVVQACNGQEALDALAGLVPDLVITDIMMPVLDGIEFIRRLRQMPAMVSVTVVAITAVDTAETERRAREAGAFDFIVKPVDIPKLLERLYGPAERWPSGKGSKTAGNGPRKQ